MTDSFLESKFSDLSERLKAVNESNEPKTPFMESRPGSGRRPKDLGIASYQRSPRPRRVDLPGSNHPRPMPTNSFEVDQKIREIMRLTGKICINGVEYPTSIKEMEDLGELGNGTCGHVVKMLHRPSQTVVAVKQMRRSGNLEENKRITMDLEVVVMSHDCDYIVKCLGCFITDSDVWICMELMATCFDKLMKRLSAPIPEDILGKVALGTVKALHYLKENHGVMHRDVKPSNILLDENGRVKLCDFGISGRLVDSRAKTKNAGCAAYMAPERIIPPDPGNPDYDIRADVWSLGITLVELATGKFPYPDCKCDFDVLCRVIENDPPSLPPNKFSPEFEDFVRRCLTKDCNLRPKFRGLLDHPFLQRYEKKHVDVASWFAHVSRSSR